MGLWIYCKILIVELTICGFWLRCISILVFVVTSHLHYWFLEEPLLERGDAQLFAVLDGIMDNVINGTMVISFGSFSKSHFPKLASFNGKREFG
jgi:hypothetical protein